MLKIHDLFTLEKSLAKDYLNRFDYPWEALTGIHEFIIELGSRLGEEYQQIRPQIWVHKEAKIAQSAHLGAPCIIGKNTEVRHCAYIRENALVGENCVIGNSVELKNVILFDNVQVPHFNYVGDSILGYGAHLGAGVITSNVKSDRSLIVVKHEDQRIETKLKKMGAILGDDVEVGCNAVLNPGTIIAKESSIYPLTSVRGVIPPRSIVKSGSFEIIRKK